MRIFQFTENDAMRYFFLLLLSVFSSAAIAAKPVPSNLENIPPPPLFDAAPEGPLDDETPVTITKQKVQTVEEFRVGGKLYMIKITPKDGAPYYLVDDQGDGKFVRQESLDSGFRPPKWVIHRF